METIVLMAIVICLIIAPFIIVSKKRRKEEAIYLYKLSQSGIHEIDRMTGHEFELYLKSLFLNQGYRVTVTPGSGDYGADLILEKDDQNIAVQAKRYGKPVGVKAVQEVIAGMNYYKCADAWVVSNNTYTRSAIEMASKTNVSLIGRDELIDIIMENKFSRVAKNSL